MLLDILTNHVLNIDTNMEENFSKSSPLVGEIFLYINSVRGNLLL